MNTPAQTPAHSPIPSRMPPSARQGPLAWLHSRFCDGWMQSLLRLLVLGVLAIVLPPLWQWGVTHAVLQADNAACRAASGVGACWGVVTEKGRLILFGRYPYEEQWRPLLACALLIALCIVSTWRRCWRPALLWAGLVVYAGVYGLMHGGMAGLSVVETARWGGLPLTLLLATVSLALAFPLSLLLALGRQSPLPAIRSLCIVFIELVRGGLQAVPKGQIEAAQSLGLGYWQIQRQIVLPQALRLVVPAIVNTFIGAFKDTSLVTIVSLYDLTGAVQLALGDADWRKFFMEGQLFVAAIYFIACFAMSRYSQWLEAHLNTGTRRS